MKFVTTYTIGTQLILSRNNTCFFKNLLNLKNLQSQGEKSVYNSVINNSFASPDLKGELFNSSYLPFLFGCKGAKSQVPNLRKASRHLLYTCVLLCLSPHSHFIFTFSLTLIFYIHNANRCQYLVRRTVPFHKCERQLREWLPSEPLSDLGSEQVTNPLSPSPRPKLCFIPSLRSSPGSAPSPGSIARPFFSKRGHRLFSREWCGGGCQDTTGNREFGVWSRLSRSSGNRFYPTNCVSQVGGQVLAALDWPDPQVDLERVTKALDSEGSVRGVDATWALGTVWPLGNVSPLPKKLCNGLPWWPSG